MYAHVRFVRSRTTVTQATLFSPHETVYDALGADITAAGGFKLVASKLWPSESITLSAAKLRNSVNPDQPHKLCPDEVLAIKKLAYEHGSTCTVDYEAQQLGYQCTWLDPQDEAEQLNREVRDLLALVNRKLDQKTRAEDRALKAVK
jgi:hypothetical protein